MEKDMLKIKHTKGKFKIMSFSIFSYAIEHAVLWKHRVWFQTCSEGTVSVAVTRPLVTFKDLVVRLLTRN